jgi:hypothetical protein
MRLCGLQRVGTSTVPTTLRRYSQPQLMLGIYDARHITHSMGKSSEKADQDNASL